MKRKTLLLSLLLWVFAATGQSIEMDPQDYEKLQKINLAEREAAKHSFEQTKRSTAIPAQKDIFADYSKGLTYPGNINVIIVSPDTDGSEALRAALDGYAFITATSYPQANLPSLTLEALTPYDVLIAFNNNQWLAAGGISPNAAGDIFAAYIDQGGMVVESSYIMDFPASAWAFGGNYISGNYSAFTQATTDITGSFTLGTVLEAGHPLLTDVTTLGITAGLIQDNQVATGATGIVEWSNGSLLVAAKDNVVSMNLLPVANGALNFTGDGVTLYANSVVWLMMNLADPDAPAAPTALTATAADLGVLEVALAWTNPSETFDGGTLTELTEVRVLRNGELIHTVTTPTIGGAVTYTDDDITDAGTYSYSVYGVNTDGEGPAASVSVYVGEDIPAAPQDVTLVAQGNGGHVSWTAPAEGLNGGYISGTDLTYTLVRMPGAVEVATAITAVEFTDTTVPGIGNYFYTVTVSNAIGEGGSATSNVALLGVESILLYETFDYEIGTIPPGWTVEAELDPNGNNQGNGMVNWAVRNFSTAGGTAPQMRFTWNPRFEGMSRLITGPIDTDGNSELRLRFNQFLSNFSAVTNTLAVRVSFDGGDTWTDLWTHAIVGNIPAQVAELYIDVPAGKTTMHLAWEFNGDAYQINNWDLDNIILEPVLENDLVALSISGTTTPSEGIGNMYTIAVQNAGTATQSDYTVKLMKEGGVEIASVAGTAIEFGETLAYELPWTPGEPGPTYLYGYVDFAADELPGNNQTANLNVVVQPGDIIDDIVVTIGTGTNYPNVRIPFDFFWRNSLSQTLYFSHEIDMGGGVLSGVQYTNNFATNLPQKAIRIWVGETELDDLTVGWVDPTSLQLVFDGAVNFPSGENNIFINFDNIYIYTGGNLVIYTQRVWEQDYYSSNDRFYGTEDPGSNRTRRVAADGTAGLDPMNPTGGAASNWHPNTSLYFSTAGLGALEGTVTDGTDPVEGVMVRVLGAMVTTLTDADGFYEFPYLLPNTYNIEFSKFGYETKVVVGVIIEEDEVTLQDAVINPTPQYIVTGVVEGNDGVLQAGTMVTLQGYEDYMVMTEADGSFEIENVFDGTYILTVVAAGYELYVDETVEVDGADLDLGTITVIEIIVPPANLQVDVDGQDEGNALLTWSDVAEREFRYDDGTATGQLGSGGGTLNTVLGSAHRKDAVLQEMSWYLTAEGGPHNTVKVWVFGLDANGNPNPQDVLYQMAGVPNTDLQWNTYEFTTPVEASNGFLIGLSYAGFLGIGTDAGTSTDWPFMPNSNFFVANYTTGPFSAIEGLGAFPFNFLIRAFGVDNGAIDFGKEYADHGNAGMQDVTYSKLPEPVVTGFPIYNNHNSIASKAFTGYNVFLDGDQVATEITEMEYLFEDLDEGTYTAGVQSVYTTGTSDIITVDFQMVFGVPATFTVTTNSGDSPQGVHVVLTNQYHDQYVYEHTVGADGVAHFESVRKGMYTLHITHDLFHDYIAVDINIQDAFTHTAELVEIIRAPYGLLVETEGLPEGDALFSWNNALADEIFEGFEGTFLPEGWSTFNPDGGTGWEQLAVGTAPLPGWTGGEAIAAPDGGSFMAFTSWEQGGTASNDQYLVTPELVIADGFEFSFYLRYWPDTYLDNIDIRISMTTNDNAAAFDILVETLTFTTGSSTDWQLYTYDLTDYVDAGETVYVAFREHVVDNFNQGAAIMLDNVYYGVEMKRAIPEPIAMTGVHAIVERNFDYVSPAKSQKAFVGYNVFLNGAEVASEVTTTEHMFTDLPHGTHTAGVQSVYTSGVSEIVTIDFNVEEILPIITFNVDMTNAPGFNPLQHNVYLTGNFTGWSEPGTGGSILMTRVVKEKTKINFFENFENYGDFTTELAPWINIDVHGNNTWGSTDFDFEGETQPFGWKIMNPGLTTPPINNTHPAHSGSKYLFSVASNPIPPGNEENKWLISPPLVVTAELNLSFYAKSITHAYGVERMRVYISTGGSDIDDFVMISSSPYLEIPLQWTEYTFSLEAWAGQTIRFAVENVSVDAFMLFLDSFSVTHGEESDSLIYTASVAIDEGEAVYKYFSDAYGEGWWGGEWPGDPNRIIEVSQSMTINDTWGVYEGVLHTLSLNVFPPSSGSVSGQGQYPFGEEVTLSAFPNDGYSFNNWTDSHGNIINYNSSFVYSMPAGSITLTANFGPEDPNLQLVTFHVKDSSNNAIYNAQITVMPDDKTSDNMNSKSNPIILHTNYLGQASFNATSGDYSYLVEKTGYLDVTGNFSVESSFVNIQVIMPDDMQVYTVTFNLDMIYAAPGFDPDVHTIYLTGGMNGWIEPGTEGSIEMIHVDGTIFTAQMELQTGVYYYKYFSDANGEGWMGGEWAGIHDREFVLHNHMVINDIWGLYDDIFFDLSLQANPASSGSATGSGQYQAGEIANLQALASTGFIFLHWTDQEGNIVYEAADPQHTMYAGHHTLIANFTEETTEQYQLTLVALPEEGGQVTGSGYYYQGEQVTITAAPNQGYVFQNWRKNGNVIGTQSQMVYTMPAEHVTLTAHFFSEDNPLYTLTLQSQPQVGGTVAGAGDYLEGEEIMLSANPSEGYDFIRWLELGTGNVYTDAIFTYTMPDRDVTLVAYFDLVDFVQQQGIHNLKLFPNPAQSNVTISCGETINKIEITDITGKLVYRTIPQDTEILVSLAGWENGIYIVRIFTSEQVYLNKLHVQK